MCNPVLIGSAALMAAGTGLQMRAASKAEDAANAFQRAESRRQSEFQQQAQGAISDATTPFNREEFDQAMSEAGAAVTERLKADQDTPPIASTVPMAASAPRIVAESAEDQSADARAFTDALAEARGNLMSFGQALLPANIGVGRSAQDVARMGNFMRGSASVLPVEMRSARERAKSPLGDLLVSIGASGAGAGMGMPMGFGGSVAPGMGTATAFTAGGMPAGLPPSLVGMPGVPTQAFPVI